MGFHRDLVHRGRREIAARPLGECNRVLPQDRRRPEELPGMIIGRRVQGNGIQPRHRYGPNCRVLEGEAVRHWVRVLVIGFRWLIFVGREE